MAYKQKSEYIFKLGLHVLSLICCVLLLVSVAGCDDGSAIDSAVLKSDKITVTFYPSDDAQISLNNQDVSLIELTPDTYSLYRQYAENGFPATYMFTPNGDAVIASKKLSTRLSFRVPFKSGAHTRLLSAFILASENGDGTYSFLPGAVPIFVTNTASLAEYNDSYRVTSSIKGLSGADAMHTLESGTAHTTVTVYIDELLLGGYRQFSERFSYDGACYYVDGAKLAELDSTMSMYHACGVNVYIQVKLSENGFETFPELYFSDPKSNGGRCLIATESKKATAEFAGFLGFLAERYCSDSYGGAKSFVIGDCPDIGLLANSYIATYENIIRTAYTEVTSISRESRVYASLGGPLINCKVYISGLYSSMPDIPWGVALSMPTESATESRMWVSDKIGDNDYISPNVLNELVSLCSRCPYEGEMRRIAVIDYNCGATNADNQAVSCAYTYYSCLAGGYIEAVIWNGLYDTVDGDGKIIAYGMEPEDTERKIWSVYCNLDRDFSGYSDYIKNIIGDAWSVIYDSSKHESNGKFTSGKATEPDLLMKFTEIFDFNNGEEFGFTAVNGDRTEIEFATVKSDEDMLVLRTGAVKTSEAVGFIRTDIEKSVISKQDYICINAATSDNADNAIASEYTLVLLQRSDDQIQNIYTASSKYESGKAVFDISEFNKSLKSHNGDSITLGIFCEPLFDVLEGDYYTFELASVSGVTYPRDNSRVSAIIIIAAVTLAAIGVAVLMIIIKKSKGLKPKKGD